MARKKKTIHYIYKTTCLITGRYYIGMHSTSNLEDGYMGSGTVLRRSIRKYGVNNHVKEILEFFESRELLIEAEKKAITEDMVVDTNCMNLKHGGEGGFTVEQQRLNAIKANQKMKILRETNPEWVKQKAEKMSETTKKQYDLGLREKKYFYDWNGKKHDIKTIELMKTIKQNTGLGETNSQYGTCWINKDGLNKKIKKEELDSFICNGWIKGRIQSEKELMNLKQNKK